jgi:predicted amidohydrolase YtcJ
VTGRDLGREREALTPEEALRSYTLGGAYATGREDRQGSISPGKLADLVVLSEDVLTIPPARLAQVKVDATIVDGRVRYERERGGTNGQ